MENNVETLEEYNTNNDNNNNKKKNNKGLLIGLIICIIVIICLSGYIYYDKVLSNNSKVDKSFLNSSTKKADEEEDNDDKENRNNKDEDNKSKENANSSVIYPAKTRKCTGTYYGETSGTQSNGLSYNFKYTLTLKDDGSFDFTAGPLGTADTLGTTGVYIIIENTISLTGRKHTTGPVEQDPEYTTEDYVMAQDCSYILINDDSISFKLMKK